MHVHVLKSYTADMQFQQRVPPCSPVGTDILLV